MNTTQIYIHLVYTLPLFIWMAVVKVCAYFLKPSEERHAETYFMQTIECLHHVRLPTHATNNSEK